MSMVRHVALIVCAACAAIVLPGCQPSTASAPAQPTLVSLAVTPDAVTLDVGATQPLAVTGTFSDASTLDLTCGSTFASSASTIAAVDNRGVVTAKAAGAATITATHSGGCSQTGSGRTAQATITVAKPPLVSLSVTPATAQLAPGATRALTVGALYADASTELLTSGVTFQSSDEAIATVSGAGLVTAVAPGSATITATQTSSGKTASSAIGVAIPPAFATITFDSSAVTYTLTGFSGAEDSTVVPDPAGGGNKVARVVRSAAAAAFAGTVVSTGPNQTAGVIPLDAANTRMTVRVYSPRVGIHVRLKVENSADASVSVETEAVTALASTWETLTFDFANPAAGSGIDPAATYDRVVLFFNFGVAGATAGAQTYYFDDVTFIGGTGSSAFSDITFDAAAITYTLTGFNGAEDSTVVPDPAGGGNKVARVVRSATAATFAGTTVSTGPNNTAGRIPFADFSTAMTVRVYSPGAGIPVRLKVEDSANAAVSVETEAVTTAAGTWETLTFDFGSPVQPPSLDLASTYDRVTIFFDFGVPGAIAGAQTFYFDDVAFLQ